MSLILIVDDNPDHIQVLSYKIKRSPSMIGRAYQIVTTDSGMGALEYFTRQDALPPDVMFMDTNMPKMDGDEACKRLRDSGITVPIYGMTLSSDPEYVQRWKNSQATGFVHKDYLLTNEGRSQKVLQALGLTGSSVLETILQRHLPNLTHIPPFPITSQTPYSPMA